jgi:hypothetical protein
MAAVGEEEGAGDLGISQHAWVTLDGRGGQHAGELLVSFTFIKVLGVLQELALDTSFGSMLVSSCSNTTGTGAVFGCDCC